MVTIVTKEDLRGQAGGFANVFISFIGGTRLFTFTWKSSMQYVPIKLGL